MRNDDKIKNIVDNNAPKEQSVSGSTDVHDFRNQYTILNELGRGAFSVVYKVKSIKNGNIYCVKKIKLTTTNPKLNITSKLSEIKVLEKLNNDSANTNIHLVNYYGSYIENDFLYILMEYCEYGDLYSLLHSVQKHKLFIQEDILWDISYQCLLGLDFIHSKKIIHRDIKLLNIFMNKDKVVKIGDMGMSKIVENDEMNLSRVGTPLFLAPELVKKEKYDYKIDLWSLGCSIYHLAKLIPPFTEENLIKLGNSIVKERPPDLPNIYSQEFKDLVNALLVKDKYKRVSAKEAIDKYIPERVKIKYNEKFKNYKKSPFPIGYNLNNLERNDKTMDDSKGKNETKEDKGEINGVTSHNKSSNININIKNSSVNTKMVINVDKSEIAKTNNMPNTNLNSNNNIGIINSEQTTNRGSGTLYKNQIYNQLHHR